MALIKSTILSSIRGSINGTTFSQNRYGAYARNRTALANPNTGNQILARAGLAAAAQGWKTLTDAQRLAWVNYATNTPVPNRIGDMVHLSGINMYVKTNAFISFITGLASLVDAPPTPGIAAAIVPGAAVVDTTAQELALPDMAGGSVNAGANYGYWISAPVSAGVAFYKGPWTYVGSKLGTTRTAVMPLPFAALEDQIFYVRVRYMDELYKVSSPFITGPTIAVAI